MSNNLNKNFMVTITNFFNGKASNFVFTVIFIFVSLYSFGQYSCSNNILITRQVSGNTQLAQVDVLGNDFNINTINTYTGLSLNASVYYNGVVYAMNNGNSIFKLSSVANTSTSSVVTGLPSRNWNNAGVTFDGKMYLFDNGTFNYYVIDLTPATPTLLSGPTTAALVGANTGDIAANVIWGDVAVDPTTGKLYVWYHPTVANTRPGLYEFNTSTNQLNIVGAVTPQTMGCLMFDKVGNLYAYGSTGYTTQDRLFSVNKSTGAVTQIGSPDNAVAQADGLSCVFSASITLASPTSVDYSTCSTTNFNFTYGLVNSSGTILNNTTVSQTLDPRLSFSTSASALQTTLSATFGAGVSVAITSAGGGTNNVLSITNNTLPIGTSTFVAGITKATGAVFTNAEVISNTATLGGLAVSLGSSSTSDNPNTSLPNDNTNFAINLTSCIPPTAVNDSNGTLVNSPITINIASNDTFVAGGSALNLSTIDLNPSTAPIDTSITVSGQGTFTTVGAPAGSVIFTPVTGYLGTVAPVNYTINNLVGLTSNQATISIVVAPPTCTSNILVNPSFENPVVTVVNGNNIQPNSAAYPGWNPQTANATAFNIIRVNGLGYADGPVLAHEGDQYLDINGSNNYPIQTFTIATTSIFKFSGWFSNRAVQTLPGTYTPWTARIEILDNANNVVASSNTFNFTTSTPPSKDTWQFVEGTSTVLPSEHTNTDVTLTILVMLMTRSFVLRLLV